MIARKELTAPAGAFEGKISIVDLEKYFTKNDYVNAENNVFQDLLKKVLSWSNFRHKKISVKVYDSVQRAFGIHILSHLSVHFFNLEDVEDRFMVKEMLSYAASQVKDHQVGHPCFLKTDGKTNVLFSFIAPEGVIKSVYCYFHRLTKTWHFWVSQLGEFESGHRFLVFG